MKAPIARPSSTAAGPFQPSGAKANPHRQPNLDLTCTNLGAVTPPPQDHGKGRVSGAAPQANPSKGEVTS